MNIAIDIDDTLTDSFDYFMPFVAEYFHVDVEFLRKNNISYCTLLLGKRYLTYMRYLHNKQLYNHKKRRKDGC